MRISGNKNVITAFKIIVCIADSLLQIRKSWRKNYKQEDRTEKNYPECNRKRQKDGKYERELKRHRRGREKF